MAGFGRLTVTSCKPVGIIQTTHQYDVTVKFEIGFDWGGWNYDGAPYSITCDGQTQSGSTTFAIESGGGTVVYQTIATKTFRITMPTSGQTKKISISATINTYTNPPTISASTTYNCPAVTWQYTITYNTNGISGITNMPSAQTKNHNTNINISSKIPNRPGYIFKGWSISNTSNIVSYSAGSLYTENKNITLYPVWSIADLIDFNFTKPNYTVNDNGNGIVTESSLSSLKINITTKYTQNNYLIPFYFKIMDMRGQFSSVRGPYTAKDFTQSSEQYILIEGKNILNSLMNYRNEKETKFKLLICTGDSTFSPLITITKDIIVNLVDFSYVRPDYSSFELYRISSTQAHLKLDILYSKSYGNLTSPKIKYRIDKDSLYTTLSLSGSGNRYSYSGNINIKDQNSHTLEIIADEGINIFTTTFRIGLLNDETIELYKENNTLKCVEIIENDSLNGFVKGGRAYASEFIETNEGMYIGNKFYFGEIIEK